MGESDESATNVITIYTDGACIGNPGRGGYGVVMIYNRNRKELSGGFRLTTNNRMEIMAAIIGLEMLRTTRKWNVRVYSDSQYLVNAMSKGWATQWQAKRWMRDKDTPVKNPDLWQRLLDACEKHQVEFVWVKGHAGNTENERCDVLSMDAASGKADVYEDAGYTSGTTGSRLLLDLGID